MSLTDFGLKLVHRLVTDDLDRNISFSPASVYLALGMLSVGSQEETKSELEKLLGVDYSVLLNQKSDAEESLIKILETLDKSTEVNEKIYTQLELDQKYLSTTEKVFKSTCEKISFAEPEKAARIINEWVKEKTKGRIENLIKDSNIQPDTGLVLVNTIYFKDHWEIMFDSSDTQTAKFQLESGKEVDVKMMHDEYRADIYDEEDRFISLKRKFKNSNMVGLFILPYEGKKLKDFLLSFDTNDMMKCVSESRQIKADVYLPKCVIKMDKNISETLNKCGLVHIFNRDRCNLRSMSHEPLYVSDVCHSSMVAISEEGVEAAAATSTTIVRKCAMTSFEFLVNRPFVFIIYDTVLNIPVFINAILDPTQ